MCKLNKKNQYQAVKDMRKFKLGKICFLFLANTNRKIVKIQYCKNTLFKKKNISMKTLTQSMVKIQNTENTKCGP